MGSPRCGIFLQVCASFSLKGRFEYCIMCLSGKLEFGGVHQRLPLRGSCLRSRPRGCPLLPHPAFLPARKKLIAPRIRAKPLVSAQRVCRASQVVFLRFLTLPAQNSLHAGFRISVFTLHLTASVSAYALPILSSAMSGIWSILSAIPSVCFVVSTRALVIAMSADVMMLSMSQR